jgi:hypothetical protein
LDLFLDPLNFVELVGICLNHLYFANSFNHKRTIHFSSLF